MKINNFILFFLLYTILKLKMFATNTNLQHINTNDSHIISSPSPLVNTNDSHIISSPSPSVNPESPFLFRRELEHNVRLCLDGITYISTYLDPIKYDPINFGYISGNYYGSSTRIDGGEIWHPVTGYNIIQVRLQILVDSTWQTLFEEIVDFCEEVVKLTELKYNDIICFERFIARQDGMDPEPEILSVLEQKAIEINSIRTGLVRNANTCDSVFLSNENYEIYLNLRDLHRWDGEVQISGCKYTQKSNDPTRIPIEISTGIPKSLSV